MNPRHDMYRNVHKGLRRALCALVADAGSADTSRAALAQVAARWLGISALLDAHHQHEDVHIGPHLARIAPALLAQMEAEHEALGAEQSSVDESARALIAGEGADLVAQGLALYRQIAGFMGRYFGHMAQEEGPYLRALQEAYDDATLAGIEGGLVASIAPPTMATFLTQMLPAMNGGERAALLAEMREHAPPEAFTGTLALAELVLDAPAYRALASALALPAAVAHV